VASTFIVEPRTVTSAGRVPSWNGASATFVAGNEPPESFISTTATVVPPMTTAAAAAAAATRHRRRPTAELPASRRTWANTSLRSGSGPAGSASS